MTDSSILEYVLAAAVPAITILMIWSVKLLTSYLDTKINDLKNKTDNELLNTYIDIIYESAVTIVRNLNQTVVDDLKAASEDGKLNKDDAVKIKNNALELLYSTVSEEVLEIVGNVYSDLEKYLGCMIERIVNEVKE